VVVIRLALVVIRLYTSSSFRVFNEPLLILLTNNEQTKSQHPLCFTAYILTEGIKKLLSVEAERDSVGYNTENGHGAGCGRILVTRGPRGGSDEYYM
jgi:hypothetical protein